MKKKKKSISKLKKEAWKVFSKWIRNRDNWTCYTCGKKMEGSPAMHAGHFITRLRSSTMFSEDNVRAQCMYCNMWRGGESGIFAQKLIEELGKDRFDALVKKSNQLKRFTEKELIELKEKYKI